VSGASSPRRCWRSSPAASWRRSTTRRTAAASLRAPGHPGASGLPSFRGGGVRRLWVCWGTEPGTTFFSRTGFGGGGVGGVGTPSPGGLGVVRWRDASIAATRLCRGITSDSALADWCVWSTACAHAAVRIPPQAAKTRAKGHRKPPVTAYSQRRVLAIWTHFEPPAPPEPPPRNRPRPRPPEPPPEPPSGTFR
jgi:hypothetical protein